MSEAVFDHSEGLTNFDNRIRCNIILLWSAIISTIGNTIWNTPGYIFSTITGQKTQNSDGFSSNPIGNAIGNMFGGDKSNSSTAPKQKTSNSTAQQESIRKQMMSRNSSGQASQSNNSVIPQTSQSSSQAAYEQIERQRRQALVKSTNSGKSNQL